MSAHDKDISQCEIPDRFLQSLNIKEAQQYLWEASLAHNFTDTMSLQMVLVHVIREIENRRHLESHKRATTQEVLDKAKLLIPKFGESTGEQDAP